MTTIIEQADAIVGINPDATALDAISKDRLRVGTYIEWLSERKTEGNEHLNVQWRPIPLAEQIVRLHKPKGDGLPDLLVHGPNMAGHEHVVVRKHVGGSLSAMTLDEQCATVQYLNRCLAQPVRRLLAMYDVADPGDGVTGGAVVVEKPGSSSRFPPVICWLVPRGERC